MKKRIAIFFTFSIVFFTAALSAAAQDILVRCVNFEMLVPSINAKCQVIAETTPITAGQSPVTAHIKSNSILLPDYKQDGKIDPAITIYPTSELAAAGNEINSVLQSMTTIIQNSGSENENLSSMTTLPFLPWQDQSQLLVRLAKIDTFGDGMGFRAIISFGTAGGAPSARNLIYTAQGLSANQSNYLSMTIPISNNQLNDSNLSTIDWSTLSDDSWSIPLSNLDKYFESIKIDIN